LQVEEDLHLVWEVHPTTAPNILQTPDRTPIGLSLNSDAPLEKSVICKIANTVAHHVGYAIDIIWKKRRLALDETY
jgi:hypothetical protein